MTAQRFTRHTFAAPCGVTFTLVLGNSTYSVDVRDCRGKRIEWSGRHWGPSLTDALSMAAYRRDPAQARAALGFLFRRIDGYVDGPGILDLWLASELRTEATSVAA